VGRSHPNVVAIPGNRAPLPESDVAAADLQLSGDEIAELTAADGSIPFADPQRRSGGQRASGAEPARRPRLLDVGDSR
jgi:hypothetical protein